MKCHHCDHEFNIFVFAYRPIRRCPSCKTIYEMKFPLLFNLIPLIIAAINGLFTNNTFWIDVAIFIVIYYIIDIGLKIFVIYHNRYTIIEK